MRLRGPTPDELIDRHLHPEIYRENDPNEQEECRPPPHEVVEWHLTYIAEAYLPSHTKRLQDGLKQAGWSDDGFDPGRDIVPSMRESPAGGGWTNLAILVPEREQAWIGPVRPAALPDGVASVRIALWSVTSSLTVLVAGFEWDEYRANSLDRIAKTDYATAMIPASRGRRIYAPFQCKELEARRLRRTRHNHITAWLRERVPGGFADLNADSPTLDVITTAQARPFCEEPRLGMWDVREALGLERRFPVGTSVTLPAWRLAFPDDKERHVLTLAARTVEGFDERVLGIYGGGVSAWGLANHLQHRVDGLMGAWATGQLLVRLQSTLATTRDQAPTPDESPRAFAKRLSNEVNRILRRGIDAAAFCGDVLERPREWGPLRMLEEIDWIMHYPGPEVASYSLQDSWRRWIREQAQLVRRLEKEQQASSSAVAELTGLAMNIRTQNQLRLLTFFAVLFAAATILVALLK